MHESQVVSFFSLETWWDTWPDSHKLLWMGAVDFSGDFEDDQVYLVYAEGGIDIDPESRGEIATEGTEYEPLTISGKNVVYAYGEHLKQNIYGVNPIAGAASFYIAIVAQSDDALMDDANLRARLDEAARLLTEDIDNNGLVTWEDLLAFDMRHNMNKFLGSPALLDAFIAASNTEVWTADTYQAAENLVEDAWRAARN
jgi:hypothetical protein